MSSMWVITRGSYSDEHPIWIAPTAEHAWLYYERFHEGVNEPRELNVLEAIPNRVYYAEAMLDHGRGPEWWSPRYDVTEDAGKRGLSVWFIPPRNYRPDAYYAAVLGLEAWDVDRDRCMQLIAGLQAQAQHDFVGFLRQHGLLTEHEGTLLEQGSWPLSDPADDMRARWYPLESLHRGDYPSPPRESTDCTS